MQNNNGVGLVGSDVPIGLGMLLMEDSLALNRFASLSADEKSNVLRYVESGVDGEDAKRRILHTVKSLHDGVPNFYMH